MLCELNQAKAFEQFTRLLLGLAARHPAHIQSQHDVLLNGPPGQKQWLLRHISRSAGPRALLIAINDYFSSIRLSGIYARSEEHTSESSHANISYAVFCLKKKKINY